MKFDKVHRPASYSWLFYAVVFFPLSGEWCLPCTAVVGFNKSLYLHSTLNILKQNAVTLMALGLCAVSHDTEF